MITNERKKKKYLGTRKKFTVEDIEESISDSFQLYLRI